MRMAGQLTRACNCAVAQAHRLATEAEEIEGAGRFPDASEAHGAAAEAFEGLALRSKERGDIQTSETASLLAVGHREQEKRLGVVADKVRQLRSSAGSRTPTRPHSAAHRHSRQFGSQGVFPEPPSLRERDTARLSLTALSGEISRRVTDAEASAQDMRGATAALRAAARRPVTDAVASQQLGGSFYLVPEENPAHRRRTSAPAIMRMDIGLRKSTFSPRARGSPLATVRETGIDQTRAPSASTATGEHVQDKRTPHDLKAHVEHLEGQVGPLKEQLRVALADNAALAKQLQVAQSELAASRRALPAVEEFEQRYAAKLEALRRAMVEFRRLYSTAAWDPATGRYASVESGALDRSHLETSSEASQISSGSTESAILMKNVADLRANVVKLSTKLREEVIKGQQKDIKLHRYRALVKRYTTARSASDGATERSVSPAVDSTAVAMANTGDKSDAAVDPTSPDLTASTDVTRQSPTSPTAAAPTGSDPADGDNGYSYMSALVRPRKLSEQIPVKRPVASKTPERVSTFSDSEPGSPAPDLDLPFA